MKVSDGVMTEGWEWSLFEKTSEKIAHYPAIFGGAGRLRESPMH
jgi:hypothetical protein